MNDSLENLFEIIGSFRRKNHSHNDADSWYSCPAHPSYTGVEENTCNCGLEKHNLKIDEAQQIIKDLVTQDLSSWTQIDINIQMILVSLKDDEYDSARSFTEFVLKDFRKLKRWFQLTPLSIETTPDIAS